MKSSLSMASISTLGDRPPSRASITTVGSGVSADDESPRAAMTRNTSLDSVEQNKRASLLFQRSVCIN